jgi:hypothetical protein
MKTFFKYSNILALLGVVITVIVYFLTDKTKELTLSTNSFISLVDENSLSGSGIKVSFDSVPVTNLYKVNFSLINTGDLAITKSDLINKIRIKFDNKATLLKYEIKTIPNTIIVDNQNLKNKIELNPDLLNPNDRIDLVAYYTLNKAGGFPQTDSRIIGGNIIVKNSISDVESNRKFNYINSSALGNFLFWVMFVWNIVIFIVITWAIFFQDQQGNARWAKVTGFIIMGGGSILTMLYIIGKEYI